MFAASLASLATPCAAIGAARDKSSSRTTSMRRHSVVTRPKAVSTVVPADAPGEGKRRRPGPVADERQGLEPTRGEPEPEPEP